MKTIEAYFDMGVDQIILGTVAYKNPEFVKVVCKTFPGKIILAVDAKKDQVAIEGWTEDTDLTTFQLVKRYEGTGISSIIYTDIHRDGMSTGPNLEATKNLAKKTTIPVIASGGISDISDVESILPLSKYGVIGMITGRALYQGTLDLIQAIKLTKEYKN